jgi:hypothetical protein
LEVAKAYLDRSPVRDYRMMNLTSPSGKTPLMLAAAGGLSWIVDPLLYNKAGILKKGLQVGHKVAWRAPTAHCAAWRIALGTRKAALSTVCKPLLLADPNQKCTDSELSGMPATAMSFAHKNKHMAIYRTLSMWMQRKHP